MGTFDNLSPVIQKHIKQIAKTSGLSADDETYEKLACAWDEKSTFFEETIAKNKLEEVLFFAKDERKGAVALTYSGSLVNIGPIVDGVRRAEYTSIGLRVDVPASAVEEKAELSSDVETDAVMTFAVGPIRQSSPIFKIAVSTEELESNEEEELLTQVTQDIIDEFVEVNKTIIE